MNSIRNTASRLALILTVLFLGAFAESLHAATPSLCTNAVQHPVGLAAAPNLLLASSSDSTQNIYRFDCTGAPATIYATLNANEGVGQAEIELAVVPAGNPGGWTSGDVYAQRGRNIYKVTAGGVNIAPFVTLPTATNTRHGGITFDKVGTFGNNMLVALEGTVTPPVGGTIWRITSAGAVVGNAPIFTLPWSDNPANFNVVANPEVAPAGFNTVGGMLVFPQEANQGGKIWALPAGGGAFIYKNDAPFAVGIHGPESVNVIPNQVCEFNATGGAYFSTIMDGNGTGGQPGTGAIMKYPASDFTNIGGNILVPIEFPFPLVGNIRMISKVDSTISEFDTTDISQPSGARNRESSTFVECVTPPALMPIIKHSTDPTRPPTNADFIFGLYPRSNNSFTNPPQGTVTPNPPPIGLDFDYLVNTDNSPAGAVRGTLILTPPENNLQIPLANGAFNAAVCELKHTAGWTFVSWTVNFTPNNIAGNIASLPFAVTGETTDTQIRCINLTIMPGTTQVDLHVTDAPPQLVQYCSPGYWKQPQHFGSYPASVDPSDIPPPAATKYEAVFNALGHISATLTFPQVIATGGGGWAMLGRISGAAYLNALTLLTPLDAATVVSVTNAAFASGDTGSDAFKHAVDVIGAVAIENCPLGNNPLPELDERGNSGH